MSSMTETLDIARLVRAAVAPVLTPRDVEVIDEDLDAGEEGIAARACFAAAAEEGYPLSSELVARARAHFPDWSEIFDRVPVVPAAA